MNKKKNTKQVVSKTKVSSDGKLSKKIIIPVKKTLHSSFRIGGNYFPQSFYPSPKTLDELKLNKRELEDYLITMCSHTCYKESNYQYSIEDLDFFHEQTKNYFQNKRNGSTDITTDSWLMIRKKELSNNLSKLTNINFLITN